MIRTTVQRVAFHTSPAAAERLRHELELRLSHYAEHPDEIDARLRALDAEWDVERVLETNGSAVSLVGLVAGLLGRRRWLVVPLVVQAFLLQHALEGWCPPLPLLRRLGFRTQTEIEQERHLLRLLRGDFPASGRGGGDRHAQLDELLREVDRAATQ